MPSHTAASGLIEIHFGTTPPGLMWTWPVWQEITGIHHGLFPNDDALLPAGLSRQDAIDIKAYFDAYHAIKSKTKKFAFASAAKGAPYHPGQPKWNYFVTSRWNSWDVHNKTIKAFRDNGVHPSTLLMNEGNLENKKEWVDSSGYIPLMVDSLGRSLFGDEAFPAGSEFLPGKVRDGLQSIAQRVWNTTRVQLSRLRDKRDKIQAAAEAAMDRNADKPLTKTAVTQMIRAVAKWRDTSELFSTPENTAAATEMLAQVQAVMTQLGVDVGKRIEPKGKSKVSTLALKSLASAEDVSDIAALYHDYFELPCPDDDEAGLPDIPREQKSLNDCGGDFGVEVESSMKAVQLAISLGFTGGLPPVFVSYRHRTGANIWDDSHLFDNADADLKQGLLSRFSLHWHQLAGVHSMVRTVFTKEPGLSDSLGMLIGDEVGLGKTAQSVALIAFFNLVISAQKNKRTLPRVIRKLDSRRSERFIEDSSGDTPFLGAESVVPSLPHLIVCPGTLMPQWGSEIKTLLVAHAVDIFFYDGSVDSETFWGPKGPFQSSAHQLHNRIVIASHSIIVRDLNATHAAIPKRKKKNTMPWDMPNPRKDLTNTIFGQRFLVAIIDEAHNFRNPGTKHISCLRLLQNALVRLPMTATPLHTSSKDIASMLRLAGLPHFFTDACMAEEKEDAAALRRAKKMDDDGVSANEEQIRAVKRLQAQSRGRFLRRTTESLDCQGKPLVPLPPLVEVSGILKITPEEKAIMDKCNEQAKAMIDVSESASPTEIKTKNFYKDYRMDIVWPKENPGDPYPTFKNLQEWHKVKTTKLDVAALICAHYTSRDDVAHVSFRDGYPVFPPPSTSIEGVTRQRRILILAINGKISVAKRDKIVKTFYDNSQPARVLLLSSVGSAGLNLSCADIVIFFDQPWSSQEEQQIRGRAWRQPQKKTVTEIHLFAEDSADLVMYQVARGKKDAFNTFVNKETSKGSAYHLFLPPIAHIKLDLHQILSRSAVDNEQDGDIEDTTSRKKNTARVTADTYAEDRPDLFDLPPADATSDASSYMMMTDVDPISDVTSSRLSEPDDPISEDDATDIRKARPAVSARGHGRGQVIIDSDNEQPGDTVSRAPRPTVASATKSANGNRTGSPPTKRARQGTIGDEGRAQILADSSRVMIPSSATVPRSSVHPASAEERLVKIRRDLAGSSASSSRQEPQTAQHNRRLARLDDLVPPPRAALLGPPRDKKGKGKATKQRSSIVGLLSSFLSSLGTPSALRAGTSRERATSIFGSRLPKDSRRDISISTSPPYPYDDSVSVNEELTRLIKRPQTQATGHFLRRTTDSPNDDGKPLLPLHPLVEITGILKTTP
ncbi:hypothetical protein C0995_014639 [Termitomyces sp. Mi166|nr:hypothetical protein C0995_014639 [Termitomyces sp. Mi166\